MPQRLDQYLAANAEKTTSTQVMRLGDFLSMGREDIPPTAAPELFFKYSPEEERKIKEKGRIGYFEQAVRQDITEMIPFNPEGAIKAIDLLDAVNRLKTDDYKTESRLEMFTRGARGLAGHPIGGVIAAVKKPRNAEERKQDDIDLVNAFLMKAEEERIRGYTIGGRITQGVAGLPGYMIEFLVTGGLATIGKKGVKKAVEKSIRTIAKSKAKTFATRLAGGTAAAVMRTAGMPHRVVENYAERQVNSNLVLTAEGYNIIDQGQESPLTSLFKSFGTVTIENFSEQAGLYFNKYIQRFMPKGIVSGFRKMWERLRPNEAVEKLFTKAGWNGLITEIGEERLGDFLRALFGVETFGAENPESVMDRVVSGIPNMEEMLVEIGVLAFPGAAKPMAQLLIRENKKLDPAKERVDAVKMERELTDEQIDKILTEKKTEPAKEVVTPPTVKETLAQTAKRKIETYEARLERELGEITERKEQRKFLKEELGDRKEERQKYLHKVAPYKGDFLAEELAALPAHYKSKDGLPLDVLAAEAGFESDMDFRDYLINLDNAVKNLEGEVAAIQKEEVTVSKEKYIKTQLTNIERGMKKGKRIAVKEARGVAKQLSELIRTAPLAKASKAKFMTYFTKIQTEKQLEKKMSEVIQKMADAYNAYDQAVKTKRYVRDIGKLPTKNLPLEYKDILEELKKGYDLKKRTKKTLLRRGKAKEFFARAIEDGVDLSDRQKEILEEAEKVSLGEMSFEELEELHDTMMKIYAQGRLKGKLLKVQEKRDLDRYIERVTSFLGFEGAMQDEAIRVLQDANASLIGKSKEAVNRYISEHLRPELMYELAGMEDLFTALATAQNTRQSNINREIDRFKEMHDKINIGKALHKRYNLGRYKGFTLDYAMFVYANSQNVNNREHLIGSGMTDADIDMFEAWISKEHPEAKKAVDKMLTYYDTTQYGALDKVFSLLEGTHLKKEDNYFPIQRLSNYRSKKEEIEKGILERAYTRKAAPKKSFTKHRVNSSAAFREMSYFGNVYRNMADVQHYIAFAEVIRDVRRVIQSENIQQAVRERFGDAWVQGFEKHLKDVAYGGEMIERDMINRLAGKIRTNYVLAVLGFNLNTVIKQPVSFLQGAQYMGKRWAVRGAAEFVVKGKKLMSWVDSKSELMKNRMFNQEREFKLLIKNQSIAAKFGQAKISDNARRWAMMMIQTADKITTTMVWTGAYRKAIKSNLSEKEAVDYADKVIRRTQPMGGTLYLPTIFRGSEIQKLYTMFKNQTNQNFNLILESGYKLKKGQSKFSKFAMEQFMYAVLPGLVIGLMTRKGLPEDEEDLFWDIANGYLGSMFILGNIINSSSSGYWGGITPIQSAMQELQWMMTGKKLSTKMRHGLTLLGMISGVPYKGIERILTGRPFGGRQKEATRLGP